MRDRNFSPPPPLSVTVAGRTLAVRFVDRVIVNGSDRRYGWADVDRGELLLSIDAGDCLIQLPEMIGGAIVEAVWELCPEFGVPPSDPADRLDAAVWAEGHAFRTWLKHGILGTLADLSNATYPAVRQRGDGSWACPLCSTTFGYLPGGPIDWRPLARAHVAEAHGFAERRVRSIPFRSWCQPAEEGGGHA